MEDDIRGEVLHGRVERERVADVAAQIFDDMVDASFRKQIGCGVGIERIAAHDSAFRGQPKREPATFEASVAGEKDAFTLP